MNLDKDQTTWYIKVLLKDLVLLVKKDMFSMHKLFAPQSTKRNVLLFLSIILLWSPSSQLGEIHLSNILGVSHLVELAKSSQGCRLWRTLREVSSDHTSQDHCPNIHIPFMVCGFTMSLPNSLQGFFSSSQDSIFNYLNFMLFLSNCHQS